MTLAIFDLDNTLIGGDSDYLWGEYLCEVGAVDPGAFRSEHDRFYAEYVAGALDIDEFLRFQLAPLASHPPEYLERWRKDFIVTKIEPVMLGKADDLLSFHRARAHTLLIITATNRFITEPIAHRLGVPNLIATEPELRNGRYTGKVVGKPSFREGKVERLTEWLAEQREDLTGSWFYSDSHNDLPLLECVSHPVAVDPDASLRQTAEERNWPVISLR